jgi:hypothetical protein
MNEPRLAEELRALGHELAGRQTADPDRMAAAVIERIEQEPVRRRRSWLRSHARRVLAGLLVLLGGGLVIAPPVRAGLADFFRFGGVEVRPGPVVTSAPPPPSVPATLSLAEAERLVGFEPAVPQRLGTPDGIDVSRDRRTLSMTWHGGPDGPVRIDQFAARLDPGYVKKISGSLQFVSVSGRMALWFATPHELRLVDGSGAERVEQARAAGPTLVWERDWTTVRLEGVTALETAVGIAETVR